MSVWDYEGVLAHNLFLGETSISFESHEFGDTPLREFSCKLIDYATMDMMPKSEHGTIYRVYSGKTAQSAEFVEPAERKPAPLAGVGEEKLTAGKTPEAGNAVELEQELVEALPVKEEAEEEKQAPAVELQEEEGDKLVQADAHEGEPREVLELEGDELTPAAEAPVTSAEEQVEEPVEVLEAQLVEATPAQPLESTLEDDPVEVKSKSKKADKKEKKEKAKREKNEREKEKKQKKRSSKYPEEATLSPEVPKPSEDAAAEEIREGKLPSEVVEQEETPLPKPLEDAAPSTSKADTGSEKLAKPGKPKKSSKKSEEPKRVQTVTVTASTRPSKAKK